MNTEGATVTFARLCEESAKTALEQVNNFLTLPAVATNPKARAEIHRQAALAARTTNELREATYHSDMAVKEAEAAGLDDLLINAQLSHSYNLFLIGDSPSALNLLASIDHEDYPALRGRVYFQQGTILARGGDAQGAEALLARAGELADTHGDNLLAAMVNKNRGMLAAQGGDNTKAVDHFYAALSGFEALGNFYEVAFAKHALAIAAARDGHLPEAFRLFDESEQAILELTGSNHEARRDRCEALLIAGLFSEAATTAADAAADCLASGLEADGAELHLIEAAGWLAAGDPQRAVGQAELARQLFEHQNRPAWVAAASTIERKARLADGQEVSPRGLRRIRRTLLAARMQREATEAALVLVGIFLARGDTAEAEALLVDVESELAEATVDLRLAGAALWADCLAQSGDRAGAVQRLGAAIAEVLLTQRGVGSMALRASLGQLGRELGKKAVSLCLLDGDAETVLEYSELVAIVSSQPLATPISSENVELLAHMRTVGDEVRTGLEQRVANAFRSVERADDIDEAPIDGWASGSQLAEAFGASQAASFVMVDGELHRCDVLDGAVTHHQLGPVDPTIAAAKALAAEQRRHAFRPSDGRWARIRARIDHLDGLVLREFPRRSSVGGWSGPDGDPLVVATPPELAGLPWASMASVGGRPTVVSPGLTAWLNAASAPSPTGRRLIVVGPGLRHGELEAEQVRTDDDRVLAGSDATVDEVLVAMSEADCVHVVAHGQARLENPLLSHLSMSDGPLWVYDLARLGRAPTIVVLSSCELGYSSQAPDTAMLGMVAGLLSAGVGTVLASASPVVDDLVTATLMAEFHRHLDHGWRPSAAWTAIGSSLRHGSTKTTWSSFTVFGRG